MVTASESSESETGAATADDPADLPRIERLRITEYTKTAIVRWERPKFLDHYTPQEYKQTVVVYDALLNDIVDDVVVRGPDKEFEFYVDKFVPYDADVVIEVLPRKKRSSIKISETIRFVATHLSPHRIMLRNAPVIVKPEVKFIDSEACAITWPREVFDCEVAYVTLCSDGYKVIDEVIKDPRFILKPRLGGRYYCELQGYVANKLRIVSCFWFRPVLPKEDIHKLHALAVGKYGGNNAVFEQADYMYRCKPLAYFQQILSRDGIMRPYLKDYCGHAGLALNGFISGLFFNSRVNNKLLPQQSPFGDTMYYFTINNLIKPDEQNLYFADFYCNYETHYITLVISEKNTPLDDFLEKWFFKLNWTDNNFFKVNTTKSISKTYFDYNTTCWIELFYTKDVDLKLGTKKLVLPTFSGSSKPGGMPCNDKCKECNIEEFSPVIDITYTTPNYQFLSPHVFSRTIARTAHSHRNFGRYQSAASNGRSRQ